MATTGDSPTAGEISTGDVPRDPHPDTTAELKQAQDEGAFEKVDVSGDFEKQYPEPSDEEPQDDVEALQEAAEDAEAETGQTWAHYIDPMKDYHTRGLTVVDQLDLGVPEEAITDNSEAATYGGVKPPRGLWFTKANRHRVNVSDAHPVLLRYLEDDDSSFEVTRY